MALDGAFLRQIKLEIDSWAIGARVDKIAQPSKEELVVALRQKGGSRRLLICSGASSPRIHFTQAKIENPKTPPMFCMLMRKHLSSARLTRTQQAGMDRVLFLIFETYNELGDLVEVALAVEIMGRHSNCILIGSDGRVVDSLKRVDIETSSVRPILPGVVYTLPPGQDKLDLSQSSPAEVVERICQGKDVPLSKALMGTVQGLSPILCREGAFAADGGLDNIVSLQNEASLARLEAFLEALKESLATGECTPTAAFYPDRKPLDFSFLPICQYGESMTTRTYPTCSELLDEFYTQRDLMARMHARSSDLLKFLSTAMERIRRKLALQEEELSISAQREELKMMGDLLSANLYNMSKGQKEITVQNYYEEDLPELTIPLDSRLTPTQNVQKYYARYRKAQTAEKKLLFLLEEGRQELTYLESVYDLLTRAVTSAELDQIREELALGRYVKLYKGRDKSSGKLPPKKYISDDGFTILVGRNNMQNDRLTLKESRNYDMWLHTKNIPGSHVVVVADGKTIPDSTLTQAAVIAAVNSKAADSSQVPVDYTLIKNIKKPPAAKPGMVIYHVYQTAYVHPDEELEKRLRAEE